MENFLVSNKEVINAVCGVIFEMHPYHNPEGIDKIVEAIDKHFENVDKLSKDSYFHTIRFDNSKSLYYWLKDFLYSIKEFKDYNISRKLKDAGVVDADDERNKGIVIVARGTPMSKDSRYTNFIDLNACIQNIHNQIINNYQNSEDCFLCKHAKLYGSMEPSDCEECKNCICRPDLRFNRVTHPMALKPHKDWTEEERKLYTVY